VLLGLEALTAVPNLRYATRSIYWQRAWTDSGITNIQAISSKRPPTS